MLSSLQRYTRHASRVARAVSSRPSCNARLLSSYGQLFAHSDTGSREWTTDSNRFVLLLASTAAAVGLHSYSTSSTTSRCDSEAPKIRRTESTTVTLKVGKDRIGLLGEASEILKNRRISVKNARVSTEISGGAIHQYTVQDDDTGKGLSPSRLEEMRDTFNEMENVECSANPWPIYTRKEVAEHASAETGIWVSYKDGVYDITDFISNHPGGRDKIMLAAGKAIDPFWRIYQQHEGRGPALKFLADMRIGDLADPPKPGNQDDPYSKDPGDRHPGLIFHNTKPCNAELPSELMLDSWLTPNPVWFIRHHHPVPHVNHDEFKLHVEGVGTKPVSLTMEDLKSRFLKREVVSTVQCGGNRRGEFNVVEKTSGIPWGYGAISTAKWGGVYLREVLMHCAGLSLEGIDARGIKHVVCHGLDDMQASIPIEKALSPFGDVLLAYEMNGEPLPPEHGAPVRLIVPGVVGVRNVKWVGRVCASLEEAEGTWQRGAAYKGFPPNIKSFDDVDLSQIPSIQEMPVQSSIVLPKPGSTLELDDIEVKGFAWSGGGRAVVRVDVSLDNGLTWETAELKEGKEQHLNRAWAWTFWEASITIPEEMRGKEITVCCRATDSSCNVQPERAEPIWNLRGLNCNCWHRVTVKHSDD